MTEPTDKQKKEARELVEGVFRPRGSSPIYATAGRLFDELEMKFASALSSRDKEIREVLEGLSYVAVSDGVKYRHWCGRREPCTPAPPPPRALWERAQVGEVKEESDVVK